MVIKDRNKEAPKIPSRAKRRRERWLQPGETSTSRNRGFCLTLKDSALALGLPGGGHSLGKGLIWGAWRGCLGLVCQVLGKGQKVVLEFACI